MLTGKQLDVRGSSFFYGIVSISNTKRGGLRFAFGWAKGIARDIGGREELARLTKSLKDRFGVVLSPSCASSIRSTATNISVSSFAPVLDAPGSMEQRPASSRLC